MDIRSLYPDLGLATLSEVLTTHRVPHSIRDFNSVSTYKEITGVFGTGYSWDKAVHYIQNTLAHEIRQSEIPLLAVRLWLREGLTVFLAVFRLLKEEFPNLKITVGGPSVSAIGPDILPFLENVDFVTFGDGEDAILSLIQSIAGGQKAESIPNTWVYNGKQFDPPPVTKKSDINRVSAKFGHDDYANIFQNQLAVFLFEDSRGCNIGCPFCSHTAMVEGKQRNKAPDACFESIRDLSKRHGVKAFRFTGSSPQPKFLNAFSEAVNSSGLAGQLTFSSFLYPKYVPALDLKALKQAGFSAFLLGIESLNQKNLEDFFGLKHDLVRLPGYLRELLEQDFFLASSFIGPQRYPQYDEYFQFLKTFQMYTDKMSILMSYPALMPNTPWWLNPAQYGVAISDRSKYLEGHVWNTSKPEEYLSLENRGFDTLKAELESVLGKTAEFGYQIEVGDEIALIARAIGEPPIPFFLRQKAVFARQDPEAIETLLLEVNERLLNAGGKTAMASGA